MGSLIKNMASDLRKQHAESNMAYGILLSLDLRSELNRQVAHILEKVLKFLWNGCFVLEPKVGIGRWALYSELASKKYHENS